MSAGRLFYATRVFCKWVLAPPDLTQSQPGGSATPPPNPWNTSLTCSSLSWLAGSQEKWKNGGKKMQSKHTYQALLPFPPPARHMKQGYLLPGILQNERTKTLAYHTCIWNQSTYDDAGRSKPPARALNPLCTCVIEQASKAISRARSGAQLAIGDARRRKQ